MTNQPTKTTSSKPGFTPGSFSPVQRAAAAPQKYTIGAKRDENGHIINYVHDPETQVSHPIVGYNGNTPRYVDPATGETRDAPETFRYIGATPMANPNRNIGARQELSPEAWAAQFKPKPPKNAAPPANAAAASVAGGPAGAAKTGSGTSIHPTSGGYMLIRDPQETGTSHPFDPSPLKLGTGYDKPAASDPFAKQGFGISTGVKRPSALDLMTNAGASGNEKDPAVQEKPAATPGAPMHSWDPAYPKNVSNTGRDPGTVTAVTPGATMLGPSTSMKRTGNTFTSPYGSGSVSNGGTPAQAASTSQPSGQDAATGNAPASGTGGAAGEKSSQSGAYFAPEGLDISKGVNKPDSTPASSSDQYLMGNTWMGDS